uniref:Uncharacterized protein n=1 Tax=Rhizophora mucronata TaxID=61149 RepID=A0A2P2IZJ5_RHIMU
MIHHGASPNILSFWVEQFLDVVIRAKFVRFSS